MTGTTMLRRAAVMLAVAACALTMPVASWAATSWNVATDWTFGANPNGAWSFGWSWTAGSPFTLMTGHNPSSNPAVEDWAGPFYGAGGLFPHVGYNGTATDLVFPCCTIRAGTVVTHPGPSGQNSVIRWTAPSAGSYAVTASWAGIDWTGYTNTVPTVLLDGHAIYRTVVNGMTFHPWTGTVTMHAGDTLDFDLGPEYSYYYGSTAVSIEIDRTDSTPPVVSVPDPIVAEATGPGGATAEFTATAVDADDVAGPVTCDPASGSTFPLGETTVTCSSTDTNGNTGTASFTVTVRDTTPPALSGVPAGFSIDATSPAGAIAVYTAPTAYDLVDGAVPVDCLPAAGATFAIGDTTVGCSATDAHGNTATASFVVHVRGAAEMLADLATTVGGLPPGKSLAAKVRTAEAYLAAGDVADTCSTLAALAHEASAQSGKKLTTAQADTIVGAAARIEAVLGC